YIGDTLSANAASTATSGTTIGASSKSFARTAGYADPVARPTSQSENAVADVVSKRKSGETVDGVSTANPVDAIQSLSGATSRACALRLGRTVAHTVSPGLTTRRALPGALEPPIASSSPMWRSERAEISRYRNTSSPPGLREEPLTVAMAARGWTSHPSGIRPRAESTMGTSSLPGLRNFTYQSRYMDRAIFSSTSIRRLVFSIRHLKASKSLDLNMYEYN